MDDTEQIRRAMIAAGVNPEPAEQTWTTDELERDFVVESFAAPFVVARRKADGKLGSLKFRHNPRVYFDWKEK
jgi:hypothetical protein